MDASSSDPLNSYSWSCHNPSDLRKYGCGLACHALGAAQGLGKVRE
jgi:hypothetical protein